MDLVVLLDSCTNPAALKKWMHAGPEQIWLMQKFESNLWKVRMMIVSTSIQLKAYDESIQRST